MKTKKIINVANLVLTNQINILEGSREITNLASDLNGSEEELFLPLIGFVSEFDDVPSEAIRKNFSPTYLLELDKGLQEYLDKNKSRLLKIYKKIIERYEKKISQFKNSIKEILIANDPIKVYFKDLEKSYNYVNEIKLILDGLPNCNSEEQVADMVRYIFIDLYGEAPKENKKIFHEIGGEIWPLIK